MRRLQPYTSHTFSLNKWQLSKYVFHMNNIFARNHPYVRPISNLKSNFTIWPQNWLSKTVSLEPTAAEHLRWIFLQIHSCCQNVSQSCGSSFFANNIRYGNPRRKLMPETGWEFLRTLKVVQLEDFDNWKLFEVLRMRRTYKKPDQKGVLLRRAPRRKEESKTAFVFYGISSKPSIPGCCSILPKICIVDRRMDQSCSAWKESVWTKKNVFWVLNTFDCHAYLT